MTGDEQPPTMSRAAGAENRQWRQPPQSSGSAWAAVTAPGAGSIWDKTAVEARVDPGAEQSKLGTSLSKSVPLERHVFADPAERLQREPAGHHGGARRRRHSRRNYETDQSAKLILTDTGTSITAGQSLSTTDDKWLRKVGAEQKLFDGVTVSGSVGETSQGAINKSMSAGLQEELVAFLPRPFPAHAPPTE